MSDKYQKLEKIKQLHDEGVLSDEEYNLEKDKILNSQVERDFDEESKHWGMDEKTYCLVMHLAQFAGYTVPLAGLILPIVMWSSEKSKSANIDAHGAHIVNWIISSIIYMTVSVILCFFVVGIPLVIILGICMVVFPIIGAIKAGNGELWRYPLTIKFLSSREG